MNQITLVIGISQMIRNLRENFKQGYRRILNRNKKSHREYQTQENQSCNAIKTNFFTFHPVR